jgi:hypothetical protein
MQDLIRSQNMLNERAIALASLETGTAIYTGRGLF